MVQTLELRATQDGVIWPRRPLVSANGLLTCVQNLPQSSYDKRPCCFRAVAFSVSGELLAATDDKGRVFVLFVTSNRYALVTHLGVPTVSCCFSPKRRSELLVTCEDETVRCLDVQAKTLISTLRGHRFPARCVSFQKSGQLALTASQDSVILWDTKDWSRFRVLNAGPGVEEAMFVAKGELVAVCFHDDTIMMWELETLELKFRFALPDREESPGLRKIAVSEDHRVLVASGRAPSIYVWEFESQTIIRIIELPLPIKQVVSHSFLPGHSTMISILGDDGSVFFLDVAAKNPQIKLEIANRGRAISAFDIECHARYLAAAMSDGYLLLYDMEIARQTASRTQARRRKEGLVDLGEHAHVHIRSGLDLDDPVADEGELTLPDSSRPVPSKLIDNLFGARHSRHSVRTQKQTQRDSQTGSYRLRSTSATRIRANTGPAITKIKEMGNDILPSPSKIYKRSSLLSHFPAQLTTQEIEVNRKRLVGSLKCNGKYPKKYRVLVWRFLLRLPKNEESFRSLVAKGKHPVFVRLRDQYPLQNDRIFRRLHRVLSAIVYWCPAFGEVSYLPAVVYPFVKIFRENDLAAFEASVSVLLHWCGDFLVSLPYPPVFAMTAIEKELARRDGQLYDHFTRYKITSEAYAWSLLKTIFTEVLSEDEWMCLWDHFFTYPETPQLLFVAVLAYLCYFRTALLAACDRFSIEQFFHQQNAIDIQKFVQLMMNLRKKLDLSEYTAIEGPAAADDNTRAHGPYWPLSRGQYPAFAHYPRFVVDFQISERNRIALEEAELAHKQSLLDQIQEESGRLKQEHDKWLKERKLVLAAEERRRKEAIAAEKGRILHLKTLDYETRKRRLQHLTNMETAAHETLEQASAMLQTEYQRLEAALAMQKERMEFEISSRKQEEELQRVESDTHDRVQGIHKHREMEERVSRLRTEFETRLKQQELQDLLKIESWKREDEAQARKAKMKLRRREVRALQSQENRVRQELEKQLLEQQVAKEKQLLELESTRHDRRQEQHEYDELEREEAQHDRQLFAEQHTRKYSPQQREPAPRTTPHEKRGRSRGVPDHDADSPAVKSTNLQRQLFDNDSEPESESGGEEDAKRWNSPTGDHHEYDSDSDVKKSPSRTPDYTARFAVQTPPLGPASSRSESSVSFASASMRRTMAEMSLLEKALGNISSSSSGHSDANAEDHDRRYEEDAAESVVSSTKDARPPRSDDGEVLSVHSEVKSPIHRFSTPPPARTLVDSFVSEELHDRNTQDVEQVVTTHSPRSFEQKVETTQAHDQSLEEAKEHLREHVTHAPAMEDAFTSPLRAAREVPQPRTPTPSQSPEGLTYDSPFTVKQNVVEKAAELITPHAEADTTGGVESVADSESYASSHMMDALQRPIAELEKKLGIRFDDFSDEEKEALGESFDDSFDVRQDSDEEEDETIEDDRAKLLQRAKKLLEMESFDDSDSDEDLSL